MSLYAAGRQTLDIVAEHSEKFEVVALAAGSNVELLAEQIRTFQPQLVALRCVLCMLAARCGYTNYISSIGSASRSSPCRGQLLQMLDAANAPGHCCSA